MDQDKGQRSSRVIKCRTSILGGRRTTLESGDRQVKLVILRPETFYLVSYVAMLIADVFFVFSYKN